MITTRCAGAGARPGNLRIAIPGGTGLWLAAMKYMADDQEGTGTVPTWPDGVVLTREEKAALTPAQWSQYADASVVRDLAEIDQLPEPVRSWAHATLDQARSRVEQRIAGKEHREAS